MTPADRSFTVDFPHADGTLDVEHWPVSGSVRLVLCYWLKGESRPRLRRHVQSVFLPFGDGVRMGLAVIGGECPPSVLADWIEDHPDGWGGDYYAYQLPLVTQWLRLAVDRTSEGGRR